MANWDITCEELANCYNVSIEDTLKIDFGLTDEEIAEVMKELFGD